MNEKAFLEKLTYVSQAESVVKNLVRDQRNPNQIVLTTSQLRNILAMVNELYTSAQYDKSPVLSDDIQSKIQYVKMKIAYNVGRDSSREKAVRDFVAKSKLMEYLNMVGNSREKLLLVCNYTEALVAYHKYYGGKD